MEKVFAAVLKIRNCRFLCERNLIRNGYLIALHCLIFTFVLLMLELFSGVLSVQDFLDMQYYLIIL